MRRDEQLSSLMDDQLAKDELRFLLQGLASDADARDKWRRFHDIGDAIRGERLTEDNSPETIKPVLADISGRVMAAIEAEQAQQQQPATAVANEHLAEPAWVKRLVSFAVAASVATVAVFVANDRGLLGSDAGPSQALQTANVAVVQPVAQPAAIKGQVAEWSEVSPALQDRLARYFNSQEEAPVLDLEAMSQYSQLVGFRQAIGDSMRPDENLDRDLADEQMPIEATSLEETRQ